MANLVKQHDFNEMLVWETAIIMLKKPECDLAYGDEASWHFIKTVLTGKNDRKACIHFLKSEAAPLAKLSAECIKVRSERSRELCLLLRNIEPSMKGEQNNPSRKVVDSSIVHRIDQFYSPVEKKYGFLQSFKAVSDGLSDERKIQVFSGLLEREVLEWFLVSVFLLDWN